MQGKNMIGKGGFAQAARWGYELCSSCLWALLCSSDPTTKSFPIVHVVICLYYLWWPMQAKQGHPTLTDTMEWIVNQFPYRGHIVPVQQSNFNITLFVVRQCLKRHCGGEEVPASLRIQLFQISLAQSHKHCGIVFVLTDAFLHTASCNHIFGLQPSTSIVSQEHTECATMWHLINFFIVIFLLSTLISIRSGCVQVKRCGNGFW